MNIELSAAYRKARNGMSSPANYALYVARESLENRDFPRFAGDRVETELPHGERVVMTLEYDADANIDERLGVSVSAFQDWEIFDKAPDYWQGRGGAVYVRDGRRGYVITSDAYPFDVRLADYRRQMSRHAAYLAARASVDSEASMYRKTLAEGFVGYVVQLQDADGNVVMDDSCWGFEATTDHAGREALSVAAGMIQRRAIYWFDQIAAARGSAARFRSAYHALAVECRSLERRVGPNVCEALRSQLAYLRASHKTAIGVLARSAA